MAAELLKAHANVKAVTRDANYTPLHIASKNGNAAVVRALLNAGADVNARESAHGQTPLIFAAEYNRADAIRVLLKHGADANAYTTEDNIVEDQARDQAAQKKRNEVLISFMPQARKDSVTAAMKAEAARLAANPGLAGGRGTC